MMRQRNVPSLTAMRKSSSSGFTLSELAVALVVVVMLSIILMPVFVKAREMSQAQQCLSNMRVIGRAIAQYDNDYDGYLIKCYYAFPWACDWGAPNGPVYYTWRRALKPYQPLNSVWTCPSSPYAGESKYYVDNIVDNVDSADHYWLPFSYVTNSAVIGFANGECVGPSTPTGLTLTSDIVNPTATITVSDSRTGWNNVQATFLNMDMSTATVGLTGSSFQGGDLPPFDSSAGTFQSHFDVVNSLYADGHVKGLPLARTVVPIDYWQSGFTQAERESIASTIPLEYHP